MPVPWLISARDPDAVVRQAGRLHAALTAGDAPHPAAVARTLAGRTRFPHRAAVVARTHADLLAGLTSLATGTDDARVVRGLADRPARVAFVFAGQGAQRPGMGAELADAFPVFAAALHEVAAALDPHLDRALADVLSAEDVHRTRYAQPALFAVEVALARLLAHHGLRPDLVAGHSVGEVAAAHVAGALTLPEAAALVAARGRLMDRARSGGAMLAVQASEQEVQATLAAYPQLSLAAVNGPMSVVLSGDPDPIVEAAAHWAVKGRRTRRLRVSHAFHSAHMDEILTEFAEVAAASEVTDPQVPFVSTATGDRLPGDRLADPAYWTRQLRGTVRFADAVTSLRTLGATVFVEVGPDAALVPAILETLGDANATVISTGRAGRPEPETAILAVAAAHTAGAPLDPASIGVGSPPADLPTYPFHLDRYWLAPRTSADPAAHPLLHTTVDLADRAGLVLAGELSRSDLPWLADHVINGAALVPATALLEMARVAGERVDATRVDELTLAAPLAVPAHGTLQVQVSVDEPDPDGGRRFTVHARADSGAAPQDWRRCVTGRLVPSTVADTGPVDAPWPPPGAVEEPIADLYPRLAEAGYDYRGDFTAVRRLWRVGDEVCADLELPSDADPARYRIHPALLDAALHPVVLQAASRTAPGRIRLPFTVTGADLTGTPGHALRARITPAGPDTVTVTLTDATGRPAGRIEGLTLREVDIRDLAAATGGTGGLWTLGWQPLPAPSRPADPREVLTLDGDDPLTAVRTALHAVRERLTGPLTVVTRHAVSTPGDPAPDPAGAAVWGLLRSVQAEHPDVTLVDLGDGTGPEAVAAAVATGEPQVAVRGGTLLAPASARRPPPGTHR